MSSAETDGKLNLRGKTRRMVQDNTEDFVNIVQSVRGYGLFWDNPSPTLFRDDGQGMLFESEVGEVVDYYFIYGGNADGVIAGIRALLLREAELVRNQLERAEAEKAGLDKKQEEGRKLLTDARIELAVVRRELAEQKAAEEEAAKKTAEDAAKKTAEDAATKKAAEEAEAVKEESQKKRN